MTRVFTRQSRTAYACQLWYLTLVFTLLLLLVSHPSRAAEPTTPRLSLDGYLSQVRDHNLGVRAHDLESQAAADHAKQADLITSPQIFGRVGLLDDKRQTVAPFINGMETKTQFYQLGVQQQNRYGTQAQLSTMLSYFSLHGASPYFVPVAQFYSSMQMLEITQSLLRNGFGSETRAEEDAIRAEARARAFSESYQGKVLLATAEIDYWKLAATREAVQVRKDNLERARRLEAWSSKRAHRGLGHQSDLFQAQSAVKMATLSLQAALDDERAAAWAFNTDRGQSTPAVTESLDTLDVDKAQSLAAPPRHEASEQVKAAEQAAKAANEQALLQVEKIRPSLDLTGGVGLYGRATGASSAYGNSFSTNNPVYAVGVKFTMPLDFGLVSDLKEASRREQKAAELRYQQSRFEEERQWDDLIQKLGEAKRQLALARELEKTQEEKYLNEREQHQLGMTTMYQVLVFEHDYANAQLNRLKLHTELLSLLAKMKILGGAQ